MRAKERWVAGIRTRNKLIILTIKAKVGSVPPAESGGEVFLILEFLLYQMNVVSNSKSITNSYIQEPIFKSRWKKPRRDLGNYRPVGQQYAERVIQQAEKKAGQKWNLGSITEINRFNERDFSHAYFLKWKNEGFDAPTTVRLQTQLIHVEHYYLKWRTC